MTIATDVVFVSLFLFFFWDILKLRRVERHRGWRHPAAVSQRSERDSLSISDWDISVVEWFTASCPLWCHTLYQCAWNTSSDQNLRSSREVCITSGNLANAPFPHVQSFVFRIWWLKHVAVFCHNVFQGEESRHGRMSTEGGRLHWTAGCPSVTGPGPVYKWRSR